MIETFLDDFLKTFLKVDANEQLFAWCGLKYFMVARIISFMYMEELISVSKYFHSIWILHLRL